jgi:hypothetical protein
LDKAPPVEGYPWYSLLKAWDFFNSLSYDEFVGREIDTTSEDWYERHDDISHKWTHNFTKSTTNNDSDSEIYDIATHSKWFEFIDKWHMKILRNNRKIIVKE